MELETDSGLVYISGITTSERMLILTLIRYERKKRDFFNFVSHDFGATWNPSDAPIGSREENVKITPIAKDFGEYTVLCTYGSSMLISQDSGRHWIPFNEGLPSIHVMDMEVKDEFIYVSVWGHGVWKRAIADLNNYQIADPESALNISVGPNPSTGLLRMIALDPIQSGHLQWFDISGRLCLEQDIEFLCDQSVLELPFQNGVYFYKLTDSNGRRTGGKIILSR